MDKLADLNNNNFSVTELSKTLPSDVTPCRVRSLWNDPHHSEENLCSAPVKVKRKELLSHSPSSSSSAKRPNVARKLNYENGTCKMLSPNKRDKLQVAIVEPIDLFAQVEHLRKILSYVYKRMPKSRLRCGSDSFSYHKVSPYLEMFKESSLECCKLLADKADWQRVVAFSFFAVRLARKLPSWDDPTYNSIKEKCLKGLNQCYNRAMNQVSSGGLLK